MKLLPRLIDAKMLLALGRVESGKSSDKNNQGSMLVPDGRKEVDVELWDGVGLAIHEYGDELRDKWRISHVDSGQSILRHIKSRQEAVYYMMKVYDWRDDGGDRVDWYKSEDRLRTIEGLRGMLLELQKEISGVMR